MKRKYDTRIRLLIWFTAGTGGAAVMTGDVFGIVMGACGLVLSLAAIVMGRG